MIYFDNAATTRTSDTARDTAIKMMTQDFANPSSVHKAGLSAAKALKNARSTLLSVLGSADPLDNLVFTSGGTEANNLAIFGAVKAQRRKGNTVIFSDSEHPSVYNCARELERMGLCVKFCPTKNGEIDIQYLESVCCDDVILISIMSINNETGAVYDISAVNKIRNKLCKGAILHTDAVQAFCKSERPLCASGADLISVSSHKIYAPKGAGALYIRRGTRIIPSVFGGEQENGIRPGTQALPAICAFAASAKELSDNFESNYSKVSTLSSYLISECEKAGIEVVLPKSASAYVNTLILPKIKSEVMLRYLSDKDICVSAGSACTSKHRENRVLTSFGLSAVQSDCAIRVSFSHENTTEEIDTFISALKEGTENLIRMS